MDRSMALNQKSIRAKRIKREDTHWIEPIKRGCIGHFFNAVGMLATRTMVRLAGRGLDHSPSDTPYILAANHETYVDGMLIASFLPRAHFKWFSSLAAQDLLTDHGIFGRIIMHVGRGIPLDRNGNPARGLMTAKKQVDRGNILLVHPEGTRTTDGQLGTFQNGASYLAMKADVPLVPVFIDGGYEVFNRHMAWPQWRNPITHRRRRIIITFGEPMMPRQFKKAQEMTDALTHWMKHQFEHKEVPRQLKD